MRKGGVSHDYVTGAGCSDDSDMSDDNVGFLLEVIQRLIPKKTYTSVIYPSQKSDEKCRRLKNW